MIARRLIASGLIAAGTASVAMLVMDRPVPPAPDARSRIEWLGSAPAASAAAHFRATTAHRVRQLQEPLEWLSDEQRRQADEGRNGNVLQLDDD